MTPQHSAAQHGIESIVMASAIWRSAVLPTISVNFTSHRGVGRALRNVEEMVGQFAVHELQGLDSWVTEYRYTTCVASSPFPFSPSLSGDAISKSRQDDTLTATATISAATNNRGRRAARERETKQKTN